MRVIELWNRIKNRPGVAHLLRAAERFTGRLGNQFGAAITYFSVLALVPIIMLGFSILGFVLVVSRPDLLTEVLASISDALGSADQETKDGVLDVAETSLRQYAAIGIIGLLSAMYAGAGWAGNLKEAVRAQWRPNFDLKVKKENPVLKLVVNLGILLGLLVAVAITFAVSSVATALSGTIISWFGLDDISFMGPVLRFVPLLISLGAGWVLFMLLYLVLPETRAPGRALRRGALIGAVGLAVLQYLTTFLMAQFAGNPAAALFGPVIVLMLFLNLFAQLILFVAAWISTADAPAFVLCEQAAAREQAELAQAAAEAEEAQPQPEPELVPQHVAIQSVRVGMAAGYLTGAATGAGLGAIIASVANWFARRRADR